MEIIQILIVVFSLFALSRVFINIKDRNLEKLESIFWTLFWLATIFVAIFPTSVAIIAELLGVGRGVDLIIYGVIILLAYMIFRLYAKLENTEKRITKIVRTIAIKNENNLHK
jgi:small membrane protein